MVAETFTNAEKIAANEIISNSVEDKVVTPTFVAVHCTLAKGNSLLSVNHSECWHFAQYVSNSIWSFSQPQLTNELKISKSKYLPVCAKLYIKNSPLSGRSFWL